MSKKYKLNNTDIKKLIDWEGSDSCLATDRITVDGCRVGYMYREHSDNNMDSGDFLKVQKTMYILTILIILVYIN